MNDQFARIMQYKKRIVKLLFHSLFYNVRHSTAGSPVSAGASPAPSMPTLISFQSVKLSCFSLKCLIYMGMSFFYFLYKIRVSNIAISFSWAIYLILSNADIILRNVNTSSTSPIQYLIQPYCEALLISKIFKSLKEMLLKLRNYG